MNKVTFLSTRKKFLQDMIYWKKTKKIDDEDAAFVKEKKEHHEDVGRLDLLRRKTITKECQKIQKYSDHTSKGDKNENLKERKPKKMKSN